MIHSNMASSKLKKLISADKPVIIMQESKFMNCNELAAEFYGFDKPSDLIFSHPSELSPEYQPDGELSYLKAERMISTCYEVGEIRFNWAHKNITTDKILWVSVFLQSFIHCNQHYIVAQLDEATDHIVNEQRHQQSNNHFVLLNEHKKAIDASSIVSKTDRKGTITYINKNFSEISGYSVSELLGKNHNIVRHPDMTDAFFKAMWQTLKQGKVWRGVIKNRKKTGESYYVDSTITPLKDANDKVTEYIAIRIDITELIRQKEQLVKQTTDVATSLPNRVKLLNQLEANKYTFVALIQIEELTGLQFIYAGGEFDCILCTIRDLIQSLLASTETLFRYNDNQFAIATTEPNLDTFIKILKRLVGRFEEYDVITDGDQLFISLVCGVAEAQPNSDSFVHASIAINFAKENYKRVAVYDQGTNIQQLVKQGQLWAKKIKEALALGNIVPFGQNIVDKNGQLVYTEVLMRLRDGNEYHSPYFFLEYARQSNLYPKLSIAMIKQACEFYGQHRKSFSLNLTQSDIVNCNVIAFLLGQVQEHDLGQLLTIELVESESLALDSPILRTVLEGFKSLGCRIAIDDFGSGYSNFVYLAELTIDTVKIDGSLIKDLKKHASTVKVICDFCHSLNLKVVAEFVEDKVCLDELVDLGVDYFQGYHFDKPSLLSSRI